MSLTPIERAVIIANSGGYVLVTTADADGMPFLVLGGTLSVTETGHIAVKISLWPQIAANLKQNPHLAIVIWDEAQGKGHQLLGQVVNPAALRTSDSSLQPEKEQPLNYSRSNEIYVRVENVI
jgi:hypothetical protein